jgi:glycine cleavage system H lipoate-binding protein
MMAGVVDYKLCDREYDCERCPFDQALRASAPPLSPQAGDSLIARGETTARRIPLASSLAGYQAPDTLFYHPGHIWAKVESGGNVRMGLDDFGQGIVGRVYAVNLPAIGGRLRRGQTCWQITHQAGDVSLLSPLSGCVLESNARLGPQPALINRDPYGEGWALVVQPTRLHECLSALRYGQAVKRWYQHEIERLAQEVSSLLCSSTDQVGVSMPDGGTQTSDCMSLLAADHRRQLVDLFLRGPFDVEVVNRGR